MTRDETFEKLATVISINALHFLTLDILDVMGSMNRPSLKGKNHATVVPKVISSEGIFDLSQLVDKTSRLTR